ncbi:MULTISPECIES: hypothetical protein [Streptomyces]|uniref:hypothetical protein n=1 Tax=Streptomyces TaxID=1883 RepID=UPI0035E2AF1C
MNEAEYEERRAALTAQAEELRKEYVEAKARYDRVTDALRDLRVEWREQERSRS